MPTRYLRFIVAACVAIGVPNAASAALFWKAPDLRGEPATGAEPGVITGPLAGSTPAELRAALLWNLRAGLNVAALQCQFEPTLLTRNQYNAMLDNHRQELGEAYQTLSKYFTRTDKKTGQTKLDQYGTRTYSSFSTVLGQLTFCEAASSIGREAIFAPKGQLHKVAERRMRELRKSLALSGEQQFNFWLPPYHPLLPSFADQCWDRKRNVPNGRCAWTRG